VFVSVRPLVFVSGLTLGDYVLWNWSLNHNHDVLALISGLTLPPLGVACVWLLALTAMRMIARFGRRSVRAGAGAATVGAARADVSAEPAPSPRPTAPPLEEAPTAASASRSSSRLAA
jgi:hypothetical protein